ncbi:Pentatricopeptide repeat-containing protein At5g13770, chloroplastic [Hondaea fermentalgiana]|uniref:Pentatricopeptide repeat-containing protein At5g13770, chloroplastic n=1 Tax=Hondaea fermentalgiana TaxID=2315210 RepID=A0A2R5H060_9STRA|nr:Pentatricopeptide repeat-containing protein At5g13770, chloroplastic [Hondaea fermentalgiana]|eukprot:GBG33694.1 Pentatricopeptide repeat-containing protein At5g13770, chloroplastic [Hondaea fermentalgiana]
MDPSRRSSGLAASYLDDNNVSQSSLNTAVSETSGGDEPSRGGRSSSFMMNSGALNEQMRAGGGERFNAAAAAAAIASASALTGAYRSNMQGFGAVPGSVGGVGGNFAQQMGPSNSGPGSTSGMKRKASSPVFGRSASGPAHGGPQSLESLSGSLPSGMEDQLVYGCDSCGKQPLRDMRYHCHVCQDFDLCKECFETRNPPKHNLDHLRSMERIVIRSVPTHTKPLDEAGQLGEASKGAGLNKSQGLSVNTQAAPNQSSGRGVADDDSGGSSASGASGSPATLSADSRTPKRLKTEKDGANKVAPRRSVSQSGAIAGLAMDKMNEELRQCNIQPVTVGRLSTKAANMFMNIMNMGWSKFCDELRSRQPGIKLSRDSIYAQTLAVNAMQLASIPSAKLITEFERERPTVAVTTSMLAAIIDQLMEADEDEWFCSPVPKDEPGYYETVSRPMDLQTVSELLEEGKYPSTSPESLFMAVTKDIYQIWQNALFFNPAAHVVHDRATQLASQSVEVLTQTAFQLRLDIPQSGFTFESKSRSSNLVKSPVAKVAGTGAGAKSSARKSDANDDPNYVPRRNGVDSPRFSTLSTSSGLKRPGSARPGRVGRPPNIDPEAEIVRLQGELERAHARIDKLLALVQAGVSGMQAGSTPPVAAAHVVGKAKEAGRHLVTKMMRFAALGTRLRHHGGPRLARSSAAVVRANGLLSVDDDRWQLQQVQTRMQTQTQTQTRGYKAGKPRRKRQVKSYKQRPTRGPQEDPLNMRGRKARRDYETPLGQLSETRELFDPDNMKEIVMDAELMRQLLSPNPDFSRINEPNAWNPLPGDTTLAEEEDFARKMEEIQQKAHARRRPRLSAGPDPLDDEDGIVPINRRDILGALANKSQNLPGKIEEAFEKNAALGLVPTDRKAQVLSDIARQQIELEVRNGNIDAAVGMVEVLEEAGETSMANSGIEAIISVLAGNAKVHEAADILNELVIQRDREPTVPQVCALIDGLCRNRLHVRARGIWDALSMRFEFEEDIQLNRSLLRLAAAERNGFKARRQLGEFEAGVLDMGALRMNDMGNVHDRREVIMVRDVYHYAMQACARDADNAHHVFDIYKTMRYTHHLPCNDVTLSILINACQTLRDWELAEEIWLDCVQNDGVIPDAMAYSSLLAVYRVIASDEVSAKPKVDYWKKNKPRDYQPLEPYDQARDLIRLLKYLPSDAYFNPHYDKLLIKSSQEHEAADANAKADGLWHEAFADLHIEDRPYFLKQLQKEQLLAHGSEIPLIAQQRAMRNASIEGAQARSLPLHTSSLDGTSDGQEEDYLDADQIMSFGPGAREMGLEMPLMWREEEQQETPDLQEIMARPQTSNLPLEKRQELAQQMDLPDSLLTPVDPEKDPEAVHDLLGLQASPTTKNRMVKEFSAIGYDRDRMARSMADEGEVFGPLDSPPDEESMAMADANDDAEFDTLDDLMAALEGKALAEPIPSGRARLGVPDIPLLVATLRTHGLGKREAQFRVCNMPEEELREHLKFVRSNKHKLPQEVLAMVDREDLQDIERYGVPLDDDDDNEDGHFESDEDSDFDEDEDDVEMTDEEFDQLVREASAKLEKAKQQKWSTSGEDESPSGNPGEKARDKDPRETLQRVWAASNDSAFDEDSAELVDMSNQALLPDVPERENFKSDRAHMYARADAAFAKALNDGITPDVNLLNNYLAVHASGLRMLAAEELFDSLYTQYDVAPDKYTYLSMIKMYARRTKMDKALDLFEESLTKLGGPKKIHPDTAGYLVQYLAKNDRIDESLDMLRFMKAQNFKIHERYVRILRTRCKWLEISTEEGLIPPDPHAWKHTLTIAKAIHRSKHSKKARKRSGRIKHVGHRLTERLYR